MMILYRIVYIYRCRLVMGVPVPTFSEYMSFIVVGQLFSRRYYPTVKHDVSQPIHVCKLVYYE